MGLSGEGRGVGGFGEDTCFQEVRVRVRVVCVGALSWPLVYGERVERESLSLGLGDCCLSNSHGGEMGLSTG